MPFQCCNLVLRGRQRFLIHQFLQIGVNLLVPTCCLLLQSSHQPDEFVFWQTHAEAVHIVLSRSPSGYETRIVSHLSYRCRVDIVSPLLCYVRTASHLVTQQQDEALNTAADRTGCISGTSTVVGHVQVCDINIAKGKKELNCNGI
jgi:hypothetical protein